MKKIEKLSEKEIGMPYSHDIIVNCFAHNIEEKKVVMDIDLIVAYKEKRFVKYIFIEVANVIYRKTDPWGGDASLNGVDIFRVDEGYQFEFLFNSGSTIKFKCKNFSFML
ncbi:hypothetical protein HF295_06685 [Hujiaoplasma nucleasis]|uniref:Uncharacterized protein n=1 Tax=Hujiaoplasma nucleasis TaxID=2725268 RepID=A0A7L6N7N3_9MOLU|nr:hypothetical protein [Hujiaoplasma nucleasis]QLY40549.1 hypothetical protein HF295_06685 [Hujiaoplasma nucleasis]